MDDLTGAAKALPAAKTEPAEDALGDSGKRALETERKARREAEQALRQAQVRISEFETAELRRDVAASKNLSPSQALRLVGSTREELEADADDLVAAFAPPVPTRVQMGSLPTEKLQPGAAPSVEPFDAGKVADQILNR